MIGMCGLFFFIVGYALVRNVLYRLLRHSSVCRGSDEPIPNRSAWLRSLAKVEAHLLQRLREGIFGRHRDRSTT